MYCSKCGTENDDSATVCKQCNYALSPLIESKTELTQEEMYQAVIGHKNQAYYLNHFSRFDKEGKVSADMALACTFCAFLLVFISKNVAAGHFIFYYALCWSVRHWHCYGNIRRLSRNIHWYFIPHFYCCFIHIARHVCKCPLLQTL